MNIEVGRRYRIRYKELASDRVRRTFGRVVSLSPAVIHLVTPEFKHKWVRQDAVVAIQKEIRW